MTQDFGVGYCVTDWHSIPLEFHRCIVKSKPELVVPGSEGKSVHPSFSVILWSRASPLCVHGWHFRIRLVNATLGSARCMVRLRCSAVGLRLSEAEAVHCGTRPTEVAVVGGGA